MGDKLCGFISVFDGNLFQYFSLVSTLIILNYGASWDTEFIEYAVSNLPNLSSKNGKK